MLLIGRDLSPYTRRVAVSMTLLGIPVDRLPLAVTTHAAEIRKHNPLGRVPALHLDDGTVLIDSVAILDHLDQTVGPERALVPPGGEARRRVLRHCALLTGVLDKGVSAYYERARRPEDKMYAPWVAQCEDQVVGGLEAVEAERPDQAGGWFLDGDRPGQADVTAMVTLSFLAVVLPHLVEAGRWPRLEALVATRGPTLPGFAETEPSV
ncbi:glutathione S-transferase family protein [Roseospira visakhapatnamensis]|uniref:Glutathione S-transferase n=1 Tax=Roseospira visakhapatnamensis TaxID=390880 RepID=A0A7W6W8I9_9PROT|nr:glutathione S-transferase family protein [Roseospira visakhapatnamensis]MBB4264456.1 glutathione S-transferase [Roseospira visakhapatnamensis]